MVSECVLHLSMDLESGGRGGGIGPRNSSYTHSEPHTKIYLISTVCRQIFVKEWNIKLNENLLMLLFSFMLSSG